MSLDNQQLHNLNSELYDELTESSEALARSEYEVLMLTNTIRVLQDDAAVTCINNQLKIKRITGRVLQ